MNDFIPQPEILTLLPDLKQETGAECEIILPDYCPNILRILQTTATATVHTLLPAADRLTAEGSVEYRVLYLAEDGSGIKTVSQQTPFSCSFDAKNTGDLTRSAKATVKSCVARALNPQKIFVRSTVHILVKTEKASPLPIPTDGAEYETNICRKNATQLLCTAEKPLRIADEFECDAGSVVISILQSRLTFRETEQKPLTDKLICKADMIFDLLCTNEENRLFTLRKTLPVSQILDLPDLRPDDSCRTEYTLLSLNLIPREKNPEGIQTVAYDVEIGVTGSVYRKTEAEWTEDVYSVKKSVECEREPVVTHTFLSVNEKGSVRESAEIGACTEILWADVTPELKNAVYRKDTDRIVCDGIWECRILMTDAEGTPCAALRELPFSLELPADGCCCPVRNDTVLIFTDLSWTRIDAGRIELKGTYEWKGLLFGKAEGEAVVRIRETGDRTPGEDTVVLYYGSRGQSAWEIAKEHACSYEEVCKTNELDGDTLTEDKMLVLLSC